MQEYLQGDTITFDISAGEGFDPDTMDFESRFYREHTNVVASTVTKADMTRLDDGSYSGTIPSETTAAMMPGKYMIEIFVRQPDRNSGVVSPAFKLGLSQFGKTLAK